MLPALLAVTAMRRRALRKTTQPSCTSTSSMRLMSSLPGGPQPQGPGAKGLWDGANCVPKSAAPSSMEGEQGQHRGGREHRPGSQGAPPQQEAGSVHPRCGLNMGAGSAENFKTVPEPAKSPSAFHYHLAPAILNSISEKVPLPAGQAAPIAHMPGSATGPRLSPPPRAPRWVEKSEGSIRQTEGLGHLTATA